MQFFGHHRPGAIAFRQVDIGRQVYSITHGHHDHLFLNFFLSPGGSEILPRWLAQSVVLCGGLTTIYHSRLLTYAKRRGETLVTRGGLYRWVRHPMYTGDMILYAGLALLAPGLISALLAVAGCYALVRQAQVEDRESLREHGEAFAAWQAHTRLL